MSQRHQRGYSGGSSGDREVDSVSRLSVEYTFETKEIYNLRCALISAKRRERGDKTENLEEGFHRKSYVD